MTTIGMATRSMRCRRSELHKIIEQQANQIQTLSKKSVVSKDVHDDTRYNNEIPCLVCDASTQTDATQTCHPLHETGDSDDDDDDDSDDDSDDDGCDGAEAPSL